VRDRELETSVVTRELGLAVRVIVDGTWGFASDAELDPAVAAETARRAVRVATTLAPLNAERIELAAEPVYSDVSWTSNYQLDPYAGQPEPREAITDHVEVLFIGGGFSALLTSARLRERGVESIRIVERGGDVGGTWYWNRYPGIACDVVSYDYLPLLDEMKYVPSKHYAEGPEIFAHCQAIARRYSLYELAVFQTTVTSTVWDEAARHWVVSTDRGDRMTATFVICANGTLAKPRLAIIDGMETFEGKSFHTSRWDYEFTGQDLELLKDKVVGIIGTGASAVQIVPNLGATAKELYVFQRTPSSIDVRDDWPTDPEWAAKRPPDWQTKRRAKIISAEGEYQASDKLAQAAETIGKFPVAIQLRFLQTLVEVASGQNSTTIFPLPIDLFRPFLQGTGASGGSRPAGESLPPPD